jgi:acyl-CoA synthetase (AMP-forming)/AMP-acid ligase II/thioesterase domain-containing protein/acyl carrier protein
LGKSFIGCLSVSPCCFELAHWQKPRRHDSVKIASDRDLFMDDLREKNRHTSDVAQGSCIRDLLRARVERNPDSVAIAAPGRLPLRCRDLCAQIDGVVQILNANGLGRGDRVAIVLPNGPEMAVAFLAVAAGASAAPLNPAFRAQELEFYLKDLHAKALVVDARADTPAREAAQAQGIRVLELNPQLDKEAGLFTLSGLVSGRHANPEFTQPQDVALVLHTSGTTSRPKLVPLTQANLCASSRHIRQTLHLGGNDRCLNVMPLFHIHGLVGALLAPLAAGGSVVCTPGFDAAQFFTWLEAFQPTWYTAVPTIHQAVLALASKNLEVIARCPLRWIRSSSSALPPGVMRDLELAFGAPVIESYGMTEASHQMCSNPLPPGVRKPGSVGIAAGPEVAVMDAVGGFLPPGSAGEVAIRGRNVTAGYENNPAANESAFAHGWFRTGDQGYLDEDAYLFLTGRLKEIINRGGEKIAPREVDDALMEHPAVAQALTFAVPHSRLGEDVAAAVVLRTGASVSEEALRGYAFTRLAAHKVPTRVVFVDAIPNGPTGKPHRIGLHERLDSLLRTEFEAARTPVETTLARIWSEVLGIPKVGVHDNFFSLEGDSLLAVKLFARMEDAFAKRLPLSTLFEHPTIAQIARILQQPSRLAEQTALVKIHGEGSRLPLFFTPSVSGESFFWKPLADYLGDNQPIWSFQIPAENGVRKPFRDIETMASCFVNELTRLQMHGPYCLVGYSFGAPVALEMAQQLWARGDRVALLAILDGDLCSQTPPTIGRFLRSGFLRSGWASLRNFPYWLLDDFLRTPREKLLARILTGLFREVRGVTGRLSGPSASKSWSRTSDRVDPWLGSLPPEYRTVIENHRRAFTQYKPRPYPGRVTLFRARAQGLLAVPRAHDFGWGRIAAGGVDVKMCPGHHGSMIKEPFVRILARELRRALDSVEAGIRQEHKVLPDTRSTLGVLR